MKTLICYKLARPDGWDFYTRNTINYREGIGGIVKVPSPNPKLGVCSSGVIHASVQPNDCFAGARIPCSAYRVKGQPVCGDKEKYGFIELKVIEEITNLDELFGWKYKEAVNSLDPFKLPKRQPTEDDIRLLKEWASVWDSVGGVRDSVGASVGGVRDSVGDSVWASVGASVWASVGASVWASVWASVGDSVRDSVRDSVGDSVWDSVGASVGDSVWDSVGDSVWAYIGSLFHNIKKWKYIEHKPGDYPFQASVELWKRGLVASFDSKTWHLHSGEKAGIVYEEAVRGA